MNYKFEFAVSAQVTAKVAEEMIKKVVEEQTGKTVNRIDMKIREISRGMGPSANSEHVFDGCTIYFLNETSKKVADNGFEPTTYG
jgi:hypothetical protein